VVSVDQVQEDKGPDTRRTVGLVMNPKVNSTRVREGDGRREREGACLG
jgi:hypothetical protein